MEEAHWPPEPAVDQGLAARLKSAEELVASLKEESRKEEQHAQTVAALRSQLEEKEAEREAAAEALGLAEVLCQERQPGFSVSRLP